MEELLNYIQQGASFENEVKNLLQLQGKTVIGEKLIGHKKVDLFFTEKSFSRLYRYAVECKNQKNKLTKKELITIINDYSALLESNLIDKLLIVTKEGLCPSCITYIEHKSNILHITYNSLLNEIIDFSQYLNYLISDYTNCNDGLNNYYIALKVKNNVIKDNEDNDLFKVVSDWISSNDNKPLAVLGSYGQGKTSFSRYLSYKLALSHLENQNERIPIFIKLSSISKEQSIEGLLGKVFTTSGLIRNYDYLSFSQLNQLGRFVILLDGFDEMKHSLSWEEFKFNFAQLNKLVCPNSKIVLLGRPNAFINDDEYNYAIRGVKNTALGIIKDPSWPTYYELELDLLLPNQIQEFLYNYYSFKISTTTNIKEINQLYHARDYKAKNITDKRIRDVSSRPVQLKMLADLLPFTSTSVEDITTTILFNEFVDLILDREYEKESKLNISKRERRRFSRLIAMFLWKNSNDYSIKSEDIPEDIFLQFIPKHSKETEKIKRDLISGCFLSRKLGNTIYFPHKSFQEFFVAEEIIILFSQNEKLDLYNLNKLISSEVSDFMCGLTGLKNLVALHKHINSYNGLLTIKLLRIYVDVEYKNFVYEKVASNNSSWYLILFALINKESIYNKDEFIVFKNCLLKYLGGSFAEIVFSLFISLYKDINLFEFLICRLVELYLIEIETIKKESKKTSKPIVFPEKHKNIHDLFLKINLSKKNSLIDLRGLSPIFIKTLEKHCFVVEWSKDKTLDLNEIELELILREVQPTTIKLLADIQDE